MTRSPSFFIIEDNAQDRYLIQRTIDSTFPQSEIRTATRISEAVQELERRPADLILLDLNLPDSIGFETFTRLNSTFPNIPIFILSVFGDQKLSAQAVSEGAADFLSKEYLTDSALLGQSLRKAFERQQTLLSLKETREKLKNILNSSSDGIVLTDLSGNILFHNRTATKLLGQSFFEKNKIFFIKPSIPEEQTLNWRPEGQDRQLTLSVSTTSSRWDHTEAFCFTLRDFTNRQAIIDALIAARKKADLSNSAKGTFLANVSHEIRTPLNGIMGAATLLSDTTLNREQTDYVHTIIQSSDFLLTLINDLLDLSRIESGKFSVENTTFNLWELIHSSVEPFALSNNKKPITFAQTMAPSLPDSLVGDPWRVRQILTNLLANAFKFTEKGCVSLHVETEAASSSSDHHFQFISFTVSDTGIGISEDILANLFTPFYQGNQEITKTFGGTGLGLAISKRLTDLMCGTLTVSSSVGQGTTFTLRIPFAVPTTQSLEPKKPSDPQPDTESKSRAVSVPQISKVYFKNHPFVLVAEDHPINQKLVVKMLENMGCRVMCANSGREAIERAAHTALDLVLMDCQMPEMEGTEAVKALRKLPQYELTPIIAMTAYVYPADIEKCLRAGMNEVLKKPFRKSELEMVVTRWLGENFSEQSSLQGPLVNQDMVDSWRALAGEDTADFEHEILSLFFTTSNDFLTQATRAIEANDFDTLEGLLHRYRGSAGHLGAERLASFLNENEQRIHEQRTILPDLIAQIEGEVEALKNHFKFQSEPGLLPH